LCFGVALLSVFFFCEGLCLVVCTKQRSTVQGCALDPRWYGQSKKSAVSVCFLKCCSTICYTHGLQQVHRTVLCTLSTNFFQMLSQKTTAYLEKKLQRSVRNIVLLQFYTSLHLVTVHLASIAQRLSFYKI